MAAEPNPYFEPYLHSATPSGRAGGSAYPTEQQQHGYPPQQPGAPYYTGQGNANTPGASTTGSQWDLQGNGYGTPRENSGLLQQQQQAYYQQQQQQQQQYSDYDQHYQQNQHQQQQPYSDNGYAGAAGYGGYGQQPPRPASPQSIRPDPVVGAEPVWSNEKSRAARAANGGSRKKWICIVVIVVILAAAGAAVAVVLLKKKNDSDDKSSNNGTSSGNQSGSPPSTGNSKFILSGGDGSSITLANGSTIVYNNKFGGNWLFDSANPFNGGQANSWTPPINQSWTWGKDRIFGVNLGGWLQLEAFITPALFESTHTNPLDEWTMHTNLRRGGDAAADKFMEDHFSTFITEADFAEIAGAGLNWVRLPLPWYAIEVWEGEPFVNKIQWKWFLKAIEWARKYGIRIQLDLHGLPGSQNGWNHSGRMMRFPTWLKTPMGVANVQRSLSYIRTLTQFISQEQYTNVVPMFGIINEPYNIGLDDEPVKSFYMEAYKMIRSITGIGKGPVISLFAQGTLPDHWTQTFMQGADRIALDTHPYWAFSEQSADGPQAFRDRACRAHAVNINNTWTNVGIVTAGEWSLAINDCNKWVGQGMPMRYELKFGNGSCARWDNYAAWTPEVRAGFLSFWRTQADALGDWFFWTWKIGPSAVTNKIEAPFWSYQLGLHEGWIPQDPRSSIGACAEFGIGETVTRPTELKPSQVGLAPNAEPTDLNSYPWPPVALIDVPIATGLPQYTPTGTIITMPGPTFTDPANPSKTIDAGSGWFNPQDTGGMFVPKSGCTYPDAWNANGLPIPAQCP